MAVSTNGQSNGSSDEIKELEKQASAADLKKKIAQAEYDAAKAKKDAVTLNEPQSEKEKAILEKELVEANKAILEAKKDMLKGPDIKALDGKITSEGTFIESRILANRTLASACAGLLKDMATIEDFKKEKGTFVIYNAADFPAMELYATMLDQLQAMKEVYETTIQSAKIALDKQLVLDVSQPATLAPSPLLLGYAAAGLLRTTADIVSLFKVNTNFSNFDLATDETALVAAFTQCIAKEKNGWTVFHPASYPINTIKSQSNQSSKFITALNELKTESNEADRQLIFIEKKLADLNTQLENETDKKKKDRILSHIKMFDPIVAELQHLNTTLGQLQTMLSTTDATTKITAQAMIMRAERTVNKLNEADVYVVKMTAISRGSNRITEGLFRKTKIMHSGGTELSCLIFAPDGQIVFANNCAVYEPYKEADEIR